MGKQRSQQFEGSWWLVRGLGVSLVAVDYGVL